MEKISKEDFIKNELIAFSNQMDPECIEQVNGEGNNNIIKNENLKELVRLFYEDKQLADNYKKSAEQFNKEIKEAMTELGVETFETNDLIAKMSIQNRESFNETLLINKLKSLNALSAIKTREYVDMDELENLIYNGLIDASQLSNCKEGKQVITLKVSKKKGVR